MGDTQTALAQVREALAARPTPGPWYLRTNRHPTTDGRAWGWLDTQPPGGSQYAPPGLQITWERGSKSEANADYIAACNPENIAAILAHVDAQAAEIERLTKSEQIEAQIEARDALLDFISENGTASEGVQHYLDRYVRAALAAKDNGNAGE